MTQLSDIVLPTINANGTSRDALMAHCLNAIRALQFAHEAIDLACPHVRDYPNDTDRFLAATEQHLARLAAIGNLVTEYTHIGVCCRNQ